MKDGSSSREKPGHQVVDKGPVALARGEVGFTPGPWHFKPGNVPGFKTGSGNPGIYAQARQSDDHFILMIADLETNVPAREIEANALLIAATPDLYAAHAKIEAGDWMGQQRFAEDDDADFLLRVIAEMRKVSREALSKARGDAA